MYTINSVVFEMKIFGLLILKEVLSFLDLSLFQI